MRFFLYLAAAVLLGLGLWCRRTFGQPSIEQILYHLEFSDPAAFQMSELFLLTFAAEVIAFPLLFAIAATCIHHLLVRTWSGRMRPILTLVAPTAIVAGIGVLASQFSVFAYAAAQFEPDAIAADYVAASGVRVARGEGPPRNLILIYAESLEDTYGDASLFGADLLAPLRTLNGQSIAAYRQAPGATWTIAGMVATQCGVPLRIYSVTEMRRDGHDRLFLPGIRCLGDILREQGYLNVFMGGAPLSFAGKGNFLRDHGYEELYGRDEWERAGLRADERHVWGLYDQALLARAKQRLEVLHAAGRPFNLTLLTLDTHNPNGFYSPHCRARGAGSFEGLVACNAGQLAEFVRFARDRGYLENTVLVILGDHLAVPNPAIEKLLQAQDRRAIFNLIVAPKMVQLNTAEALPFDMFPTLLELIGMRVEGDRLGLGYSAVGEPDIPRPAGRSDRLQRLPVAALAGSPTYRAFWRDESRR